MAPGTNTGSAHPVALLFGVSEQKQDDTMKAKIENDLAAFIRSYVCKRGRNVAVAETAVRESKAFQRPGSSEPEPHRRRRKGRARPALAGQRTHGSSLRRQHGRLEDRRPANHRLRPIAARTHHRLHRRSEHCLPHPRDRDHFSVRRVQPSRRNHSRSDRRGLHSAGDLRAEPAAGALRRRHADPRLVCVLRP